MADLGTAVAELVAGLVSEPWGQVSPSVYETGRLVTLAPWLTGHSDRLRFLLTTQRPDGGWGVPHIGYALVPTLSAVEAILATLDKPGPFGHPGVGRAELVKAADHGLRTLFRWLDGTRLDLPDMPAIEHIAPALIDLINVHLRELPKRRLSGLEPWQDAFPLRPPAELTGIGLAAISSRLEEGGEVPRKLLHALEIAGAAARGAPSVRLESTGTIGASPAATAAWLGDRESPAPGDPALGYLEAIVARYAGPVPCAIPLTVFERAWVLSWLVRAGLDPVIPAELVVSLRVAVLDPAGSPAAAGLPPDADTTAGALYALSLLGAPHPPDALWTFETETHFCTWQGENGRSVTTNAHVLEAFGHYLENTGGGRSAARYSATMTKVASWLCAQQDADGAWRDRWHASSHYATTCCALALHRFGGVESAPAVDRAIQWVLDTQRPDGSWGRWGGTAEETAYALQILLLTGAAARADNTWAVTRGGGFLRSAVSAGLAESDNPPLWHDKDLYHPTAIVRAAVLAALHLTRSDSPCSGA